MGENAPCPKVKFFGMVRVRNGVNPLIGQVAQGHRRRQPKLGGIIGLGVLGGEERPPNRAVLIDHKISDRHPVGFLQHWGRGHPVAGDFLNPDDLWGGSKQSK
jgi:hypothetical protein